MMSSPKPPKHSPNILRLVGQKVEKTFNIANSKAFHGSLSSLVDLPDNKVRKADKGHHSNDDNLSLRNLPKSPKLKFRKKKDGKI